MASPLAVGAGANEGLDTMLNRMMVQQEVNERARHDQALEGLQGRGLDQQDDVRKSLAELRDVQMKGLQATQADAAGRASAREALLNDPTVPESTKIGLRVHAALPEGDKTFPYELITGPKPAAAKSLQTHFADIDITDNGVPKHLKNVPVQVNPDPADPYVQFNGQRLNPENVHGVTSPSMLAAGLQWDPTAGLLINKPKGTASPVTGPDGVIGPQATAQTRAMQEGAKMLRPNIPDVANDAEALDHIGLFGPLMGRVRELATKLGTVQGLESGDLDEQQKAMVALGSAIKSDPQMATNRLAGRFSTRLGLLASGAGRVHGGARGGGSIQMIDYMKDLIGGPSDINLFLGKLDALDGVLSHYEAGPDSKGSKSNAADLMDPLGLGLGKKK